MQASQATPLAGQGTSGSFGGRGGGCLAGHAVQQAQLVQWLYADWMISGSCHACDSTLQMQSASRNKTEGGLCRRWRLGY